MDNISDRVIQYLDYKKISRNKFYKEMGLSVGYLTKRPEISARIIKKIINKYVDINLHWLVAGEGNMLREESSSVQQKVGKGTNFLQNGNNNKNNITIKGENYTEIGVNEKINGLEAKIEGLSATIAEKDKLLAEKERLLQEKDKLLALKDEIIAMLKDRH